MSVPTQENPTQQELAPALRDILRDVQIDELAGKSVSFRGTVMQRDTTLGLRQELASALYEELHAGMSPEAAGSRHAKRDRNFEKLLIDGLPHTTSPTEAKVSSAPDDNSPDSHVVCEITRTRIRVPSEMLPTDSRADDRVELPLAAVRPTLSPGFLLVNSSLGPPAGRDDVLRIYIHVAHAASAASTWATTIQTLEGRSARYRAKVLSRPSSFPRQDAIVVYVTEDSWPHVRAVVEAVATMPDRPESTSPLTAPVAPGVSLAWEPRDRRQGWTRMSFGQHRTTAVADSVVRQLTHEITPEQAIVDSFADAAIDVREPARNADSPDFPLEILR